MFPSVCKENACNAEENTGFVSEGSARLRAFPCCFTMENTQRPSITRKPCTSRITISIQNSYPCPLPPAGAHGGSGTLLQSFPDNKTPFGNMQKCRINRLSCPMVCQNTKVHLRIPQVDTLSKCYIGLSGKPFTPLREWV